MEQFTINLYVASGDVITPLHVMLGVHLSAFDGEDGVEKITEQVEASSMEEIFTAMKRCAERSTQEGNRRGTRALATEVYRTADEHAESARGMFSGTDFTKLSAVDFVANSIAALTDEPQGRNVLRNSGFFPEIYGEPDPESTVEVFDTGFDPDAMDDAATLC